LRSGVFPWTRVNNCTRINKRAIGADHRRARVTFRKTNNGPAMDALDEALRALAARANDPKVRMIGLSDDLLKIGAALDELGRRCGVLAAVALSKHYWPAASLHMAQWESLSKMSDHARAVYRAGTHGPECTCEQCCIYRLTR
jgi:hypothetical protein